MIVKIKKISENRNSEVDFSGFRTGRYGYISYPPQVGEGVTLFTSQESDASMLMTTVVKEVQFDHEPQKWTLKTLNSTYEVEKIQD